MTSDGSGNERLGSGSPSLDPLEIPDFLRRKKSEPAMQDNVHPDELTIEEPAAAEEFPPGETAPSLEDILSTIRKLRAKETEIHETIKILKRQADKMMKAL